MNTINEMANHRIYIQAIELALHLVSQGETPDTMMATPEGIQLINLIRMIGKENEQDFFKFYEKMLMQYRKMRIKP